MLKTFLLSTLAPSSRRHDATSGHGQRHGAHDAPQRVDDARPEHVPGPGPHEPGPGPAAGPGSADHEPGPAARGWGYDEHAGQC